MTVSDPNYVPTGCAIAWATKDEIFVRYPGPGGIPCIIRYPKTYSSLTAAFGVLIENPTAPKPVPRHPATNANLPKQKPSEFSEAAREAAQAILRKAGILAK